MKFYPNKGFYFLAVLNFNLLFNVECNKKAVLLLFLELLHFLNVKSNHEECWSIVVMSLFWLNLFLFPLYLKSNNSLEAYQVKQCFFIVPTFYFVPLKSPPRKCVNQ
jgi:hypothetical protein